MDRHAIFSELGHRSQPHYGRSELYWVEVESQLKRFMCETQADSQKFTHVVLMGKSTQQLEFQKLLKSTLGV